MEMLISEGKMALPSDLQELYNIYQQEIHSMTFNPDSLPPIHKEWVHITRLWLLNTHILMYLGIYCIN